MQSWGKDGLSGEPVPTVPRLNMNFWCLQDTRRRTQKLGPSIKPNQSLAHINFVYQNTEQFDTAQNQTGLFLKLDQQCLRSARNLEHPHSLSNP